MSIFGDAIYFCGGGGGKSVDTGLGWYAKGNWLLNQPARIGTLTVPTSGGELRGNIIDTGLGWSADSDYLVNIAGQTLVGISSPAYGYREFAKYYTGYAVAAFCNSNYPYYGVMTISTVPNNVYKILNGSLVLDVQGTFSYLGLTWYYEADYWYDRENYGGYGILTVPIIDGAGAGDNIALAKKILDAAGVIITPSVETYDYDKSTEGYSVTCMCKWKTSYGGDVYFSPVLISSVEANTAYTRNSTAISGTTTHTYEGMTFYMRKGTNDTLSGTETITSYVPLIDLTGDTYTDDTIFTTIMSAANGAVLPTS